jgi:hypothetical protein
LVSKHDSTIEFTSADTDSTVSDEPGVTVPRASPHDEDEDEDGYGDDSYGDDSPAVPAPAPAPAPVGAVAGKTGGEEDDGDDEYADDAHEEDDEDDEDDESARAMPVSSAHTAVAAVRAADATNHPPALLDRDRAGGVTPHSDMTSSDDDGDDEEEQGDCVADATGDLSPLTTRGVAGPGLSGVRRAERRRAGTLSHVPMVRQARHEQRLAHRATLSESDHKDVAASQL